MSRCRPFSSLHINASPLLIHSAVSYEAVTLQLFSDAENPTSARRFNYPATELHRRRSRYFPAARVEGIFVANS